MIPAVTAAVSVGLGCGTCCSPIISTFLSTYVVSHAGGVKKGIISFLSFFFGRVLLYSACPCGGRDGDCVQPCEHGKSGSAAGGSDRCAFKENEEGDSRCSKMVPAGFVCVADGYAFFLKANY